MFGMKSDGLWWIPHGFGWSQGGKELTTVCGLVMKGEGSGVTVYGSQREGEGGGCKAKQSEEADLNSRL